MDASPHHPHNPTIQPNASAPPVDGEQEAGTRKRRRGLVEIEASPEALALAVILGQTPEQFVADALRLRVELLTEKVRESVTIGGA
jgi:hypothetical protein